MFNHIMVGANDVKKAKIFYDAVLGTIGYKPGVIDDRGRCFYSHKGSIFALSKPIDGEPACHGNGSTFAFVADSPEVADAWHAAGISNGGSTCENPPGIREGVSSNVYLAYLRDPSGNKLCVVHRMA